MTVRIEQKIVDQRVAKDSDSNESANKTTTDAADTNDVSGEAEPIVMDETIERPEVLVGSTYRIKPPTENHAMYITINDMILNEGTPHEQRRPYEMFINSKEMEHFQWVVALTRVISATFRKGGEVTLLAEELRSVHDPSGGYFKKGGLFMPSLVAEIGLVIERHLTLIGLIKAQEPDEHQKQLIAEKKAQINGQQPSAGQGNDGANSEADNAKPDDGYPANAVVCKQCHTRAAVVMDGCLTCLECGASKCS